MNRPFSGKQKMTTSHMRYSQWAFLRIIDRSGMTAQQRHSTHTEQEEGELTGLPKTAVVGVCAARGAHSFFTLWMTLVHETSVLILSVNCDQCLINLPLVAQFITISSRLKFVWWKSSIHSYSTITNRDQFQLIPPPAHNSRLK